MVAGTCSRAMTGVPLRGMWPVVSVPCDDEPVATTDTPVAGVRDGH